MTLEQAGLRKQNKDGRDPVLFSRTILRITHMAARCFIQVLQQYFVEQGSSHAALNVCGQLLNNKWMSLD